jgi:hypothetical protein
MSYGDHKKHRTFRRVVMAYVAMLLFWSVIRFSMSTLQGATTVGCTRARALSVRIAANFRVGFEEERNSWRTRIRGRNEYHGGRILENRLTSDGSG